MFQNIQNQHRQRFGGQQQSQKLVDPDEEDTGANQGEQLTGGMIGKGIAAKKTYDQLKKEKQEENKKAVMAEANGNFEEEKKISQMNANQVRIFDKQQRAEIEEIKESDEFNQFQLENANVSIREENDVRVAVIGNVDSGKSTIVGVMTKSIMDDGRGSARKKVFNFVHEAANGRTSSIGQEIMGFDNQNSQVQMEHQNANKNQSWAHIT